MFSNYSIVDENCFLERKLHFDDQIPFTGVLKVQNREFVKRKKKILN